jgi:orotate phosphoribosyltransferase
LEDGGVDVRKTIGELVSACRGHFVFESGHHGDVWLELERLCVRPRVVRPLAAELAKRLATLRVNVVCGSLVEGAFVALLVAEELGAEFCYAERIEHHESGGLYPVEYRLPAVLREKVCGRRVAIVNDVINAGSAVRGAAADLQACGAELAGIACLMTLGGAAEAIAHEHSVPLHALATQEIGLWTPDECPLCLKGMPLSS